MGGAESGGGVAEAVVQDLRVKLSAISAGQADVSTVVRSTAGEIAALLAGLRQLADSDDLPARLAALQARLDALSSTATAVGGRLDRCAAALGIGAPADSPPDGPTGPAPPAE